MLKVLRRNIFDKDVERAKKRGLDLNKLKEVMFSLTNETMLMSKYKDHALYGNYIQHRECHIQPDWLLIYKKDTVSIIFERTGTHADLFK